MSIVKSLVVATVILAMPGLAGAQTGLQNSGGGAQQQTGGNQNTGTLQNDAVAPIQPNRPGEALSQNQPQSLGVVGSPSQDRPAVLVGPSDTTNKTGGDLQPAKNYTTAVIAIVATVVVFIISLLIFYKRPRQQAYNSEPVSAPEQKETLTEETTKKPKPKKNKKKKKAHR